MSEVVKLRKIPMPESVTLDAREFDYVMLLLNDHIVKVEKDVEQYELNPETSAYGRSIAKKLIPFMRHSVRITLEEETSKP